MDWPVLITIIVALLGLLVLNAWWLRRYRRLEETNQVKLESLHLEHQETGVQAQARLEVLLNSLVEGLLLLDRENRILLANPAFSLMFGLTANVRGKTIMEALRLHEVADLVEFLRTHDQVIGFDLRLTRPVERWTQINGAAVLDRNGNRQGTVLVFHDITRVKKLESARKDFVANVSHELRTPLSLVKGYVETLLGGAKDDPVLAKRFLLTIERNTERLRVLIEDLLTTSELESGRVNFDMSEVRLKNVADRVCGDLANYASGKGTSLVNLISDSILAWGNEDRLEQVFHNLLDNAIKYGRGSGKVVLSAEDSGPDRLRVKVEDDGPGIPPESAERVFERFYRVDKARSREQGGTGLGLSIVKHIVQAHEGRVWVESTVGKGSTFCFTLLKKEPGRSTAVPLTTSLPAPAEEL